MASGYQLGVDLGTTWTAAAVARRGSVEMVGLGNRSAAIPSVVHQSPDGRIITGDAADRRGPSDPLRVAREFKRRIGDPTPVLLGGTPHAAESLLGTLLRAVVDHVEAQQGGRPEHLTVTHPANWGPYKTELFARTLEMAGDLPCSTLTEPEAAAISYAANERVAQDALIAVYDLGGGTFDTAVLRKTGAGFDIVGSPAGIERLGGIDFDEAVVDHVRRAVGAALDDVDPSEPANLAALARLRRECVEAKEALSADTEAVIPVLLPNVQTEVRITRGEFEQMVKPTLDATVDAMARALHAAKVTAEDINAVLLVGGSSRIPLVSELVSLAFGRPIAVDAHPKHAVALGAARAAATATAATAGEAVGDSAALDARAGALGVRQLDDTPAVAHADADMADATVGPTTRAAHATPTSATDRTTDLSFRRAFGTDADAAMADAKRHGDDGAGAAAGTGAYMRLRRRRGPWDRGPFDDIPDTVPDWLSDDDNATTQRAQWAAVVIAALVLLVTALGVGGLAVVGGSSSSTVEAQALPPVQSSPIDAFGAERRGRILGEADQDDATAGSNADSRVGADREPAESGRRTPAAGGSNGDEAALEQEEVSSGTGTTPSAGEIKDPAQPAPVNSGEEPALEDPPTPPAGTEPTEPAASEPPASADPADSADTAVDQPVTPPGSPSTTPPAQM